MYFSNKRTDELRKEMETKNAQHTKENRIHGTDTESQEIKTSIERTCNRLNGGKDRISYFQDIIAVSDEKKDIFKIKRDYKKSIQ